MKFNIIFPMAGESSRFDYEFKPFLQISDETFIELAYKYFKNYEDRINQLYFIITQEQENNLNVKNTLNKLFEKFTLIILPEKTKGPFMTIHQAIKYSKIDQTIPSFICDCDHSIDISPMIDFLEKNTSFDILIPYWDIKQNCEKYQDWGIIYLNNNKQTIDFSEKKMIHSDLNYYGIIGCYYFNNLSYFNKPNYINISDGLKYHLQKIKSIEIKNAEFFGDKTRLKKTILNRKKYSTIFCDIDGTISIHEPSPDNKSLQFLSNSLFKLKEWKEKGHTIILTTSRVKKDELYQLLKKYDVPFDNLITSLPSGKRYLINDVKEEISPMSYSYNVIRDVGIDNIELFEDPYRMVHVLKGNSFSKTILINQNDVLFVRKYILKTKDNNRHYEKLKRQYYDLQRLNVYCENICPKVSNEINLDYIYSFDIEYLENYEHISPDNLSELLNIMNEEFYCTKKINKNELWMVQYLRKININFYKSLHPTISYLLEIDTIIINNKNYMGIPSLMNRLFNKSIKKKHPYYPKYLSIIHGDLTFSNILYHKGINDIKLIDPDGADYIDAIELDFGKLLQSYLSNYEVWSDPSFSDKLIKNVDKNNNIIDTYDYHNIVDDNFYYLWSVILNENNIKTVQNTGIFYMCSHLFRMIPYLSKTNINLCIYCIKEIIIWLNSII